MEKQFMLVSGDCDEQLADKDTPEELREHILDHPLLVGWFAQNCLVEHPKLHPMPIGLDYHTLTSSHLNLKFAA